VRDARVKAKALLGSIANGIDPREVRPSGNEPKVTDLPTLREAWERYLARLAMTRSYGDWSGWFGERISQLPASRLAAAGRPGGARQGRA
jgi:hypothetical protein